jgi:hypothetical protein
MPATIDRKLLRAFVAESQRRGAIPELPAVGEAQRGATMLHLTAHPPATG